MGKYILFIGGGILLAAALIFLTPAWNYIKAVFYIDHMEREERVSRMHVDRIVDDLAIRPGDRIADIGAGSGLFTRKMALKSGPEGTVFAVDINRKLLDHIEKTGAGKGSARIVTVMAAEMDPDIPEPVDLIFICDTLHYVADPTAYVRVMASYLKPGGRIAVIDFRQNRPPGSKIFSEGDLTGWMKSAGLEAGPRYDYVTDEYFAVYRKASR
jgi:cyclopropane fatty-acyl-phospholipid synthase-like methyltransferase